MKRSRGKKDENSDLLDSYAESVGAELIKCSQFADLGFDRIFLFRGVVYIVEYKNPSRRWTLTETEEKRQLQCLKTASPYNVIETKVQIAAMLGIPYTEQLTL